VGFDLDSGSGVTCDFGLTVRRICLNSVASRWSDARAFAPSLACVPAGYQLDSHTPRLE
jgi:hypothetical protein